MDMETSLQTSAIQEIPLIAKGANELGTPAFSELRRQPGR
jgi:hypothetical protein